MSYFKKRRDMFMFLATRTPPTPPFTPTPELVYTLSSDGTYYIVGTGTNTVEQIQALNEADSYGTCTDGSGLDSSWTGGEVHIPAMYNGKPVKAINPRAFNGITNITKMIIQDGQMITIGRGFMRCDSSDDTTLTEVQLPTTLTSLGGVAFQYRKGLITCNLGNTQITKLFRSTFYHCISLTSITIPSSVTSIGNQSICGCISLTSITIPNLVTSIGDSAFDSCTGLTLVILPNSITSIGTNAFRNCGSLTTFNFEGTTLQWQLNISKANTWKPYSAFTVVHCTNGDVSV